MNSKKKKLGPRAANEKTIAALFGDPDTPISKTQVKSLIPRGNEPHELPLDIEALLVKDRRSKASARVAALSEIEALESALAAAKEKLEDVDTILKAYSTLFDPIRRIPEDLLHKIFEACNPEETSVWILASVSKRWRAATMSLPSLWGSLDIDLGLSDANKLVSASFKLGLQVKRSSNALMDVKIRGNGWRPAGPLHPMLPSLLSSASRWKKLVIDIHPSDIQTLMPIQPYFHRLEHLVLSFRTNSSYGGQDGLFQHATHLRTLTFLTAGARYAISFAAAKLEHLEVRIDRYTTLGEYYWIVVAVVKLRSLKVVVTSLDSPWTTVAVALWNSITHLTICLEDINSAPEQGYVDRVFNNVYLSCLRMLTVISDRESQDLPSLPGLLARCGGLLSVLQFFLSKSTSTNVCGNLLSLLKSRTTVKTIKMQLISAQAEKEVIDAIRADGELAPRVQSGDLTLVGSHLSGDD